MEQKTYSGTYDPSLLGEDLYTAFPALKAANDASGGTLAPILIGVEDGQIVIMMPDGTDWAKVDAVVAAYTPGRQTQPVIFQGKIAAMAASAVGVQLSALTAAQIKALMAVLLYHAGGVDPATMTVKPLSQWM